MYVCRLYQFLLYTFFVNTYDTVQIVLIKIHIVFTIVTICIELAEDFFFSEIRSPRMERYTLFRGETPPSPPQKKPASAAKPTLAYLYKTLTLML
jgi:hypothetical protein